MSHRREADGNASAWMAGLVAMLLIYVLSPGPVVWWIDHRNGGREPDWVGHVYAPLIYACNHIKPIEKAYDAYFDWCSN